MPDFAGPEDPSTQTKRKPTNGNFTEAEIQQVLLGAGVLFEGKVSYAMETGLLEFAVERGRLTHLGPNDALKFPDAAVLLSKTQLQRAFKDFEAFTNTLSERIRYLIRKRRGAYVSSKGIVDLVRAASAFPGPCETIQTDFTLGPTPDPEKRFAWTVRPEQLTLADEIAAEIHGGGRTRILVWKESAYRLVERYALSKETPFPTFRDYPHLGLLRLNLYYERYVLAATSALSVLAVATTKLNLWSEVGASTVASLFELAELLIQIRPNVALRELPEK